MPVSLSKRVVKFIWRQLGHLLELLDNSKLRVLLHKLGKSVVKVRACEQPSLQIR
jgi:hypothetical protein